jgi:hypothetical protein
LPSQALPTHRTVGWQACATFAVALALFLAPWPGLGATCAGAFAFIYNLLGVERVLDSGLSIHLEPVGEAFQHQIPTSPLWHVFLRATSGAGGGGSRLAFDTRGAFYLPAATFLAFVLAARVWRWQQARRAVVAGALVVFSFTTLSVVVASLSFLAMPAVGGIALDASSRLWLETLFLGWFAAPGMGYAAALLAAACAWLAAHGREATFMSTAR